MWIFKKLIKIIYEDRDGIQKTWIFWTRFPAIAILGRDDIAELINIEVIK